MIARFVHNARNKNKKAGPLTTEEIEAQKKFWEEKAQRQGEASEKYGQGRREIGGGPGQNFFLRASISKFFPENFFFRTTTSPHPPPPSTTFLVKHFSGRVRCNCFPGTLSQFFIPNFGT